MIAATDSEQIAAAFALGDVVAFDGPCARGELGQVWKLTSTTGEWAVKEPFAAVAADDHRVTTAFQEVAVANGVPAPPVRRTVDGAVAADVRGVAVRVQGWVELLPPDTSIDPCAVGAAVAALHRVTFDGPATSHPWFSDPVGASRWDELIATLLAAHSPLADRFARWRDEFVALEQWLGPMRTAQMCHRDLFADNVLLTKAGDLCLIDWDNAGAADPCQELAMVLVEFADRDAARARTLYAAYVDAGGPGRLTGRGDFSMIIAVFGHLAERVATLWLASGATEADREREERRFDEFDDRGLSRAVIDDLLDAIT